MEREPEQQPAGDREGRGFPSAFLLGLLVVFVIFGSIVLLSRYSHSRQAARASAKLPFGAAEQAYAKDIQFGNIEMARARNLLNQEFTYVGGVIANSGPRTVRALTVVIEFRDPFNQVVLRDTEQLITTANAPLGAGQNRNFEVTLDQVPAEWNQQDPSFRITGLLLE
ncbi:MAG TPA: hypothetical protein VEJ67_14055 [Candidatus Cybelea sp.]|nr:hypothetical protein [Candidatus Cybelea sp.]